MTTRTLGPRTTPARRKCFPRPFDWMVPLWAVWLVMYFGGGLLAQSEGGTGLFASTVDSVDSLWWKLTILNLPLHLVCMALSLSLLQVGSRRTVVTARVLAGLATLLVVGHLALSFGLLFLDLAARV